MSPTHPHTVNAVPNSPDGDDDDICPVCDGECTCSSNHPAPSSSPSKPVLKIRLTVPPALRVTKSQPASRGKHIEQTTFATAHDGNSLSSAHVPKRRGRPPKNAPRPPKAPTTRRKPPPKSVFKKKTPPTKRKRAASNADSSELTDIDDDDARCIQFPTFVSASALSSAASSTDSDDSDDFDTDSSIEAEEENFILAEERARVRRELLGDDVPSSLSRRRDSWVIHPRKTSVGGLSDVDMDGETDEEDDDNDDDDDDDEEDEEAAEEDEDGDAEEGDDEEDGRPKYTGMATGWSDGEESSFDADLFFANLSGSSSSDDDDEEEQDVTIDPVALAGALASIQPRDLPFEVTEGWDGQLMFTSGPGGGVLEAEFDAMAAQFIVDSSASPSGADDDDDDVNMQDADEEDEDREEEAGDGGDTTDEDLVGTDDLPNERAMRLFNLPFELNVESINPLSTMSPIRRRALQGQLMTKSTAGDILTGKMFGEFDDEEEEEEETHTRPKTVGGPRQGYFEVETLVDDNKVVVIDNEHKPVPSPHTGTRGRGRGRRRIEGINRPLPQFILSKRSATPSSTTEAINALSITSPEPESGHSMLAPSIELDDVLDSAFLEGSSSEHSAPTPTTFEHMRNLTRWDLISVGAFRKTREDIGGWNSDTASDGHGYGGVMKSSPLAEMLWQNKMGTKNANLNGEGERTRKEIRRERKLRRKAGGMVAIPKNLKGKGSGKLFHHHHPHHPNSKSRGAGSSQRTNLHQTGGSSPIA
ncbi:uncharacterized protein BT62DRAFT_1008995 [Guyanagaster necrorhizus]|uniref:Uncharacterized protein n=1 Tax=Guyanagaster necrorhizus TaxID=856835 RepID=A0A9P7VN65_9AGAR|nr:uncharacterized protein BT62DRAFT_1008995 [Guyanagaster necrorhizus MCA 3950]KAG7443635.1 hypothetical protein BT62DRAFT_1008995 [Guyanagaster necrorhizus MCA 3950]